MANDWKYAALAEHVYRRAPEDQKLKIIDIDSSYTTVNLERLELEDSELTENVSLQNEREFSYFTNESGFLATIVENSTDPVLPLPE